MSMHTKRPNKGRGSGRVRGWLELSLFARERFTTMASTANVASHVGGKRLRVCGCMYVLLDPNEGTAHVKKTRSLAVRCRANRKHFRSATLLEQSRGGRRARAGGQNNFSRKIMYLIKIFCALSRLLLLLFWLPVLLCCCLLHGENAKHSNKLRTCKRQELISYPQ